MVLQIATISYAAEPVLSWDSYGEVVFGSRLSNVEMKLKEKSKPQKRDPGCDFVRFHQYPKAEFMVEDGVVTRADVEAGVPNILEVPVGMPLSKVKIKYPKVHIEQHHYDEEGHYLIFKSRDGKKVIVMEEGGGKVTNIRGGIEPSVEYVEGCL